MACAKFNRCTFRLPCTTGKPALLRNNHPPTDDNVSLAIQMNIKGIFFAAVVLPAAAVALYIRERQPEPDQNDQPHQQQEEQHLQQPLCGLRLWRRLSRACPLVEDDAMPFLAGVCCLKRCTRRHLRETCSSW